MMVERGLHTTPTRRKHNLSLKAASRRHSRQKSSQHSTQESSIEPPFVSPPPLEISHIISEDSNLNFDVVWDDRQDAPSPISSHSRIDFEKILKNFPDVESPVSKKQIMSLTAMESQTKESTPSSIERRKRRRWSNDNGTESLTRLCNLAATLTAHSNKAELENPSLKSDEENSKEQDSLSEFLEDSFLDHSSIIQCLNDSFDDFASPSDSTVTDIQPPTLHKVTNQNKLNTTTTCTNVNKPTSTAIPCSQQANTHSPTTSGISHSQGIKKSMDHHVGIKTRSHCPVTLTRKNHHNGSAVSPGIAQSSMENPQNSPSRLFPNSTTGSIIQKTHHNHQDRHTQCLSSHPHSIRPNSTVSSHSSSFKPQTAINSAFKPTHSSHPSNNKINYSSLQFNEIKGKRRASPSPVAPLKGSSNAQQKPIGGTSNDAKDNESETDDDDFWTKVALSVDELEEEEEAKTDDNGDELLASLDKSAIDKLFTFDDYIENKEPLKQMCSQEDIQRKKLQAKRKLQRRYKTS